MTSDPQAAKAGRWPATVLKLAVALGCFTAAGWLTLSHLRSNAPARPAAIVSTAPDSSDYTHLNRHPVAASSPSHATRTEQPSPLARMTKRGNLADVSDSNPIQTLALVFPRSGGNLLDAVEGHLLTVLPDLGLRLLERQKLDSVLDEQALAMAALRDSEQAMRLGRLIGADALLVIERVREDRPDLTLRVLETVSGVVLAEEIPSDTKPETVMDAAVKAVKQGTATLQVPLQRRTYVAVLPFQPEVQDPALRHLSRMMQPLVRAALQADSATVVLERDQLHLLVREQLIGGVPVEFRGTGRYIEGSLALLPGDEQVEIGIQITTVGDGTRVARLTVDTKPIALRDAVLRWVMTELATSTNGTSFSPEAEAERLLHRARWLTASEQALEDVEACVEAAISLDPRLETWKVATQRLHSAVDMGYNVSRVPPWELTRARYRLLNLQHAWIRQLAASPTPKLLRGLDYYRIIDVRPTHEEVLLQSKEGRELVRKFRLLEDETRELAIQMLHAHSMSASIQLSRKLESYARRYRGSAEGYCRLVIGLLQRLKEDQARYVTERSANWTDPALQLRYVHRDYPFDGVRPIVDWCIHHGSRQLQAEMLAQIVKNGEPSEAGAAAQEILRLVFDSNPDADEPWLYVTGWDSNWTARSARAARDWLAASGQLRPWIEGLLETARRTRNMTALYRNPDVLISLMKTAEGEASSELVTEALAITQENPPDEDSLRWHENLVRKLEAQVRSAQFHQGKLLDSSPWRDVEIERVRFEGMLPENARPVQYAVVPDPTTDEERLLITV